MIEQPKFDYYAAAVLVIRRTGLTAEALTALPTAGTRAWAALDEHQQLSALAWTGAQQVLLYDLADDATKAAAVEISHGTDWPQVARRLRDRDEAIRNGSHIPRKAS